MTWMVTRPEMLKLSESEIANIRKRLTNRTNWLKSAKAQIELQHRLNAEAAVDAADVIVAVELLPDASPFEPEMEAIKRALAEFEKALFRPHHSTELLDAIASRPMEAIDTLYEASGQVGQEIDRTHANRPSASHVMKRLSLLGGHPEVNAEEP